jgi:alkylation response protein AidB-like acyl-CoA dehydrogenase
MIGGDRRGGDWLTTDLGHGDVLTPERLSDEHRLVGRTAAEFVANEVLPAIAALERKDWSEGRRLLARCGDLGLLGADTPESLGGIGLDKAAAVIVVEAIGASAAFSTMFGAQTGLALIPLLCFGTPDQQARYLPGILSGEIVGAYCLSESESGSDALSLRTTAVAASGGGWILNGEKMWTTNGGFADLFVVFAKVDGGQIAAFLVERGFPGVKPGPEEHKMGLQGSSTTSLLLADARVPAGNLLGEVGKGHKIAFNVLNYGRFKLAAMCSGGAKAAIGEAARYAATRRQFGRPIAAFGAIRHKLGEMAVREYAVESMLYRTAGLIDGAITASHDDPAAVAASLEEFAVEASLVKVAGSEALDFIVDENVQIHGGNGFVREYEAERRYRDARVNRIFEGTNEINRLLVPVRLLKRGADGGLAPATGRAPGGADGDRLSAAAGAARGVKDTALLLLRLAVDARGEQLTDDQEVVMLVTDAIIEVYAAESAVLRASAAAAAGHPLAALHQDAACTVARDAARRVAATASTAIESLHADADAEVPLARVRDLLHCAPFDTVSARRRVADAVVARQGYPFV